LSAGIDARDGTYGRLRHHPEAQRLGEHSLLIERELWMVSPVACRHNEPVGTSG
jgi:hypothetical protein